MKKFSEWLKIKEDTSTGDIASYARPIGSTQTRLSPEPIILEKKKKKKKKTKLH